MKRLIHSVIWRLRYWQANAEYEVLEHFYLDAFNAGLNAPDVSFFTREFGYALSTDNIGYILDKGKWLPDESEGGRCFSATLWITYTIIRLDV